jgi:hypothetical protein
LNFHCVFAFYLKVCDEGFYSSIYFPVYNIKYKILIKYYKGSNLILSDILKFIF